MHRSCGDLNQRRALGPKTPRKGKELERGPAGTLTQALALKARLSSQKSQNEQEKRQRRRGKQTGRLVRSRGSGRQKRTKQRAVHPSIRTVPHQPQMTLRTDLLVSEEAARLAPLCCRQRRRDTPEKTSASRPQMRLTARPQGISASQVAATSSSCLCQQRGPLSTRTTAAPLSVALKSSPISQRES